MGSGSAVMLDINAFEQISIKPFNLESFKKQYDYENVRPEDGYDFSPLENIDAILIEDIFVKEEYRGQGHGTMLVNELKKTRKAYCPIFINRSRKFLGKTRVYELIFLYLCLGIESRKSNSRLIQRKVGGK